VTPEALFPLLKIDEALIARKMEAVARAPSPTPLDGSLARMDDRLGMSAS